MPNLQERTIEHDGVRIVIREATAEVGTIRTLRRQQLAASEGFSSQSAPSTPQQVARSWLALVTFIDLTSAAVSYDGMEPPELDEFLQLPEILVGAWADATYDVNPHWRGSASAQKKILR